MRHPRAIPSLFSLLFALLGTGCENPADAFTPASFIEKLRVLAVRATPPELAPGETTHLDALVADPLPTPRPVSYLWIVCLPDPTTDATLPCQTEAAARDPGALLDDPRVQVIPFVAAPDWTAPAGFLEALPEGHPGRRFGVDVPVLVVVFEGSDLDALKNREVETQVVVKSIRVTAPEFRSNTNPVLLDVRADDTVLDEATVGRFTTATTIPLLAHADSAGAQAFTRLLPDGTTEAATEEAIFSWYTTAGEFVVESGLPARTVGERPVSLQLPATPLDRVVVYVVLRDGRGGTDWAKRTLAVSAP